MYLWCNTVPFIVIDWIAVLVLLLPEAFLIVISMPLKICGNKAIMERFHSNSKINLFQHFTMLLNIAHQSVMIIILNSSQEPILLVWLLCALQTTTLPGQLAAVLICLPPGMIFLCFPKLNNWLWHSILNL